MKERINEHTPGEAEDKGGAKRPLIGIISLAISVAALIISVLRLLLQ